MNSASAAFELHPQLAADTVEIDRWDCCQVLLMNDASYPWLILVPRCAGARELHGLSLTIWRSLPRKLSGPARRWNGFSSR